MAIFNFPIHRDNHAECAVLAAREIQRRFHSHPELLQAEGTRLDGSKYGVGIGIDSGKASFGEFGRSHRDLTAIGTVVNTAARAQAAAAAGQILVTGAVYHRARRQTAEGQGREFHLKGFEKPVELYAI